MSNANPLQGIYDRLDKQDTVLKGLLAASQTPASRAGLTPADFMRGMVENGRGMAFFGPGGHLPIRKSYGKKSFNPKVTRTDGSQGTFGEWLCAVRKFGSQDNISAEERHKALQVCKTYNTQQYGRYLDHSYGPDDHVTKTALAESQAVSGGYTVLPTMFSEQLYEIAIEDSIVEPRSYKQPLTTRQCTIPALDQVNQTSAPVAGQSNLLAGMNLTWVSEAATRRESEPLFRNVVGTAWEGSFYALVSNNLLADNAVGLEGFLPQLFGRVVGWGTDFAFLQGNGSGQPMGALNCKAAIQVTRTGGAGTGTLSYADVTNMEGKLYTLNRQDSGICWIAHPTMKPLLLQLNDNSGYTAGTGRVLFQPYNQGAQAGVEAPEGVMSYGRLLGYPVFISEKVPAKSGTGDLGLYDFANYATFRRMDIEIAISTQVAFLQNSTAYRVVVRVDGQPLLGNYITYADAGANSTASPFILLH